MEDWSVPGPSRRAWYIFNRDCIRAGLSRQVGSLECTTNRIRKSMTDKHRRPAYRLCSRSAVQYKERRAECSTWWLELETPEAVKQRETSGCKLGRLVVTGKSKNSSNAHLSSCCVVIPFLVLFSRLTSKLITATMADLMFSLGQTKGKKKTAAKVKQTKDQLKDVKITGTIETEIRKDQHVREIKSKETARNQIKENMNVTVTDTVESGIRKEQHTREIKAKETARNQIKENTNFDMARSLFGGGGEEEYEEEEEE
jgi:hypothetical protein